MGPTMNGKLGWFLQEAVSPVAFVVAFMDVSFLFVKAVPAPPTYSLPQLIVLGLWVLHYFHRSVIYTVRVPSMNQTSVSVVAAAVAFNSMNGYFNGASVGRIHPLADNRILDPRFWIGIGIFFTGMAINIHSDNVLMQLRKKKSQTGGKSRYFIPYSGLFNYVR
jgi:3-oxo-5-alpha-steroid 4-dehydrogenase 1